MKAFRLRASRNLISWHREGGCMAKKTSKADDTDRLCEALENWMDLEDETIKQAEKTLKKTKNKLVKMTMEMIKNDSLKHKAMQKLLLESLTKEALVLTPDDLVDLSEGLNQHLAAEAKSLEVADAALNNSKLFTTRYILSYLIADEQKHHALLSKLNELKRAAVFVS
jgi:rubrerythrin